MKTKNRASIVLISLIVISAFTLLLALSISEITISSSYINLNKNESKFAYYLAEGCLEEAMLRIEEDSTFTGTTITLSSDTNCLVTYASNTITITVNRGDFTQTFAATTQITTTDLINNIELLNWQES